MAEFRNQLDTLNVESKGNPNDLVTTADKMIESLVRGYILQLRPFDTVVGEEGVAQRVPELENYPGAAALHSRLLKILKQPHADEVQELIDQPLEWHVDPIDGTVNFVRGIEHHCFSVGVCSPGHNHPALRQWHAGLVFSPAMQTAWYAVAGAGAYKLTVGGTEPQEADHPVRLSGTPARRPGAVVATGFGYAAARRDKQLAALTEVMQEFDDVRRMGSAAIDLCQAAEGRVNAYYERGLGIYDWAAGALIAREAGLYVYTPTDRNKAVVAADTQQRFEFLCAHS